MLGLKLKQIKGAQTTSLLENVVTIGSGIGKY